MHAVLAHGAAGRSTLPVSIWVLAYLAGMAVVLTRALVRIRPVELDPVGLTTTPGIERADRVAGVGLRVVGIGVLVATIVSAWFGDLGRTSTPPLAAYVALWVGVPVASALVGDVWRMLSPWDPSPTEPPAPLRAATHWPAAAGLLAFVWLELCLHPADPEPIGLVAVVYASVMLVQRRRRGRAWLRTGDGFAAWCTLVAAVAPLHRDGDGRLRVRRPLDGLAAIDVRPGTRAVLAVILGSVVLQTTSRDDPLALLGLVVAAAVAMLAVRDVRALVPAVVAWFVALHLGFLVIQGQTLVAGASDPLGRGWDLFGTADRTVDFRIVPDDLLSAAQLAVLAVGHAAGVLVDRSRRTTIALTAFAIGGSLLLLGR
jgi:hypothetical protein